LNVKEYWRTNDEWGGFLDNVLKNSSLEDEIRKLKIRLDRAVNENKINSDGILHLSRQLDTLIVGYYNSKNKANA